LREKHGSFTGNEKWNLHVLQHLALRNKLGAPLNEESTGEYYVASNFVHSAGHMVLIS
jgi:hypothetical protein